MTMETTVPRQGILATSPTWKGMHLPAGLPEVATTANMAPLGLLTKMPWTKCCGASTRTQQNVILVDYRINIADIVVVVGE